MICPNCGCDVEETYVYCSKCGSRLEIQKQQDMEEIDQYEQMLIKKKKSEEVGKRISIGISIILDIILLINNWGYYDIFEMLVLFGMFDIIVYAIYGMVAGVLGFFKAEIYLDKYRQLKKEIGKGEAVKIIEASYHPESGFNCAKNLAKGTGTLLGGCLSTVISFTLLIILVIVCMAFC